MYSQQEILEMIATDAHESIAIRGPYEPPLRLEEARTIKYDLRLVRDEHGILDWKDDLPPRVPACYCPQEKPYQDKSAENNS